MNTTLKEILRLPQELQGIAYIESCGKHEIRNLRGLSRHILRREYRPCGFISIDERIDENDYSLHERIAAADPADILDYRCSRFDKRTEDILEKLSQGAAAVGRAAGLSERRGQQIVCNQIERARQEASFARGGEGQGSLFDFSGEVLV